MSKNTIWTPIAKRNYSHLRNRSLGSLHFSKITIKNIINIDIVSSLDKILLKNALENIEYVIDNWDKHYCAKLFAKLNEEANNENISNQS